MCRIDSDSWHRDRYVQDGSGASKKEKTTFATWKIKVVSQIWHVILKHINKEYVPK
jgi:hypothetical protein